VEIGPCGSSNAAGLTVWTIPALDVELVATGNASNGIVAPAAASTLVGRVLHTVHRATPEETAMHSPLSIHLALDRHQARAGTPIDGTVTVTNTTSEGIGIAWCPADAPVAVGLAGRGVTFVPVSPSHGCPPTFKELAPGITNFRVAVSTRRWPCNPPGVVAIRTDCTPAPPLPAGRYRTVVVPTAFPDSSSGPANVVSVVVTG
jgi:hypothetical protein